MRIAQQSTHVDRLTEVNWWPGKLRYYESPLSLAASFCALNGISLKEYESYMGYTVGNESLLDRDALYRIASLLNEDITIIESIFISSVQHEDNSINTFPYEKRNSDTVRYCPQCAEFGFHSHLHELSWLKLCPLHLRSLKSTYAGNKSSSIASRRVDALTRLMLSHCRSWPRSEQVDSFISHSRENVHLRLLVEWRRNANDEMTKFSRGEIWSGDFYKIFDERTNKDHIGRLRKLEPMPELIEPLFVTLGENYKLEMRHFPGNVRDELHRLSPHTPFWMIFNFYKEVSLRSIHPPSYMIKLRAVQSHLRERHGVCRCSWRRERAGWSYHWLRVDPERLRCLQLPCPYDVALEFLEHEWGNSYDILSIRNAEKRNIAFIQQAKEMHDADLIDYTPEANVSPEGYLHIFQQAWRCCEWKKTSVLTDLMNTTAEFEIDSALFKVIQWLDKIEIGAHPSEIYNSNKCVYLKETEQELVLIKWTSADG
ncbi:hypothetical protein KSF73_17165 [Burkholderiaceae bacterium DAT-1]|nr:hypothetical protein [Burkholderiaceae bacterium DAT-1]